MRKIEKVKHQQREIINTIKILIYKENPFLLEKVDFDNDEVFLEPLLFAYFNSKKESLYPAEMLQEIIQGYFIKKEETKINYSFNEQNVAYIPGMGYLRDKENSPFEPIIKIGNTNIEILKYRINLLKNSFRDTSGNVINETEIEISESLFKKNIFFLTNAFRFIKENSEEHSKLIEQCCKACIMFKTNPDKTNSFATINAHGVAFLNVYQDEYDEVFFVDDIAHQTGHIILTTLFYERKSFFKIDENQDVEFVINKKDHRSINILFHALYTYYTSLMCLNDCLKNNYFNKKQQNDAIGRIGFYINKCTVDLNNFEKINCHFGSIENVLTSDGIEIYLMIKEKYLEVLENWSPIIKCFDYSNQAYNFSFKKFIEFKNNLV